MSATKSASSKTSKTSKPSGMTKCSGCRTSVRSGTTPSTCKTCEKVSKNELIPCKCGSSEISTYRAKGFAARNCIRCIFLGYQDIRTAAQEEAVDRYQLCDGVCGLVQPIGRKFCHDCQACADVNPILRKKLSAMQTERRVTARNDRWNKSVWSDAFAQFDAQVEADKRSKQLEAKTARAEQDEEDNLVRILRFAQSGKARAQGLTIQQVDAPTKKVKPLVLVPQVVETKPVVVVLHKSHKTCDVESLAEFPML